MEKQNLRGEELALARTLATYNETIMETER